MNIHSFGTPVFIRDTTRSIPQDDGSIVVLGEVINRAQGAATGVMIIATATDEVCDLLAVEEKEIGYLHSGQRRPFKIILQPQVGEVIDIHLHLAHDPIDSPFLPNDSFDIASAPPAELADNEHGE